MRRGVLLMLAATGVFAVQDGISRHLAETANVVMVVMIRYWFFALVALWWAARQAGGLARAAATRHPRLQLVRGLLLAANISIAVWGFTLVGIVNAQAIFMASPLIVTALSGPILGERVGWRRWLAILAGFGGVLLMLAPTGGAFAPGALLPLAGAALFALYALLTRHVSADDGAATSFLWTGATGAVVLTAAGVWFLEPMAPRDWGWMAVLCVTGATGHLLLIRAYEAAEASAIQPYAYFQLVFGAAVGVGVFGEVVRWNVALGAAIVVGAGLFALWRARLRRQPAAVLPDPPEPPR